MFKIALVGMAMSVWLGSLAAAQAVTPCYNQRASIYYRSYGFAAAPNFAPSPSVIAAPYDNRERGCFVTNNKVEAERGIRHWWPAC